MYLQRIQEQKLCFPSVMRMIILAFYYLKIIINVLIVLTLFPQ